MREVRSWGGHGTPVTSEARDRHQESHGETTAKTHLRGRRGNTEFSSVHTEMRNKTPCQHTETTPRAH